LSIQKDRNIVTTKCAFPAPFNLIETDKHEGLHIDDIFSWETWASLQDLNDIAFKFSRLGKGIYQYAVVYIDPRRSSDRNRIVVDEFKQLSTADLGISLAIVTWDDPRDLQKLAKKKKIDWCMLLNDPLKTVCETKFMVISYPVLSS
jgi:hypothetical protein